MPHAQLPALRLITVAVCLPTGHVSAGSLRVHFPFDGSSMPVVSSVSRPPVVSRGTPPQFADGIRGKALVVGGEGSAMITFKGTEYIDPRRGSIVFWTQAVDWDATEDVGTFFFRLPNHAFLYRYARFHDQMSFYYKRPHYEQHQLHSAALPLRKGQWMHVAVTWSERVLKMYTDGECVAMHQLREPMTREHHGQGISFGAPYTKRRTLLDELYIFDFPLADTEVERICESSRGGGEPTFPRDGPLRVDCVHFPMVERMLVYAHLTKARRVGRAHQTDGDGGHGPPYTARVRFWALSGLRTFPLGECEAVSEGATRGDFLLPSEVPAGNVRVKADVLDGNGQLLCSATSEPFEKRVYVWQRERIDVGVSDEVIPPFTPLKVKGRHIQCWGRDYHFGEDGWPVSIVSRREELLTAAARPTLTIAGQPTPLKTVRPFKVIRAEPGIVEFESSGRAGELDVEVKGTIEYDGMIRYALSLVPAVPAAVAALRLDLALPNDRAVLYHACRDGIRRTNEAGKIPAGRGKVWGSSAKPSRRVIGTFLPYFWIGDYDRGLCWMCDNDKGWAVPDDQGSVELIRDDETLTARINFITREKTLREPWQVTFALMAGPCKPEPPGWRMAAIPGNAEDLPMPEGVTGPKLRLKWYSHVKSCQGYGKPPDLDAFVKHARAWRPKYGHGWGVNTSPNDFWYHPNATENLYFSLVWRKGPLPGRNAFVAHTIDRLYADDVIEGLYSDDTYPQSSRNLINGAGYVREDGKLQAGYQMFALRDFFKRLAVVHHQRGGQNGLLCHMTDAMILPCYSFYNGKHDNEWGRRVGDGKDHIDGFPLDEIAARSMSRQWGLAATWHTQANWDNSATGGDDLGTLCLLHDIVGRIDTMDDRTLPAKLAFDLGATDVEFVGYWALDTPAAPRPRDIKVSAWVRRKRTTALITVANLGTEDWAGGVRLPWTDMGLDTSTVVCDGEERHATVLGEGDSLRLSVPRHDYRILLAGPPGTFPHDLPPLGASLPRPEKLLPQLCDDFSGRTLSDAWELVRSDVSDGELRPYRGRLTVIARDYRFAAAQRRLGMDNVTAQVRVERRGRHHVNRVGLALLWDNSASLFAGPFTKNGQFHYALFGTTVRRSSRRTGKGDVSRPGHMHQVNWVRVELRPDTIVFCGSGDGRTWHRDWELARPPEMIGAPAWLRLGKNPDGHEDRHRPARTADYFDDLVIGLSDE